MYIKFGVDVSYVYLYQACSRGCTVPLIVTCLNGKVLIININKIIWTKTRSVFNTRKKNWYSPIKISVQIIFVTSNPFREHANQINNIIGHLEAVYKQKLLQWSRLFSQICKLSDLYVKKRHRTRTSNRLWVMGYVRSSVE